MAESTTAESTTAESVITPLLQNFWSFLGDQIKLHSDVEAKIKSMCNELEFIKNFLKNSEGKRYHQHVNVVVRQIRDVAHEAEDVVDTYIASTTIQRSRNKFQKLLHYPDHQKKLRDVDAKIENIKKSIDDIYKHKDRYDIGEGEFKTGAIVEAAESLRKRRRDVEEEEVVGLVHDSNIVIEQLMETNSNLNVVSIIGMGGLGKTTLARKIYNEDEVKDMFPYRAWGYVSNDYRAKELLQSLLRSLRLSTLEDTTLSEEQLKKKVSECLQRNRYLIVLDDIWNTQAWDDVKGAFPNDRNGSRILITSRIRQVALHTRTTFVYDLPLLDAENSWQLFSKKVFGEKDCPRDLEPHGRAMVKSCKGLPLAIIVLAGMVAKKDLLKREWSKINMHLPQDKEALDILKLSYDNLPQELKPCFLYLGIYPEDYEIKVRDLIQLWIAEGFIQPPETRRSNEPPELEDVADWYLDELIDRSLVQVAARRSDGGVKTCRIHDLLRDLCILESKEDKFMDASNELNVDKCNSRRLSLHCKSELRPTEYNQLRARSLFLFGKFHYWNNESDENWKWVRKSFELARVLDLGPVLLSFPATGLQEMVLIKYLNIRTTKDISTSICSLLFLETLHIWSNEMETVPSGIWKLKRLRHVYLGSNALLSVNMSEEANSANMLNLQTLCTVSLNLGIASMMNNGCFPKLRKLGLKCLQAMSSRPEYLQSLHSLSNLRALMLYGDSRLSSYPGAIPSNLLKITLKKFSVLDSRDMKTLGQLTKLETLKLKNGSIQDSLNCAATEFPQLQVFQMSDIKVKRWRLETGAMPCLERIVIERCFELRKLPEQLFSLTTLQQVHALGVSNTLANRLENVRLRKGCKPEISNITPLLRTESDSDSDSD